MIPRNDCPDGPTRQEALAAVRSAEDKLDEAAELCKDYIDSFVNRIKMHDGGELDIFSINEPGRKAQHNMHLAVIDLLDAKAEAKAYGHMSDEAEMERAANEYEARMLGRD